MTPIIVAFGPSCYVLEVYLLGVEAQWLDTIVSSTMICGGSFTDWGYFMCMHISVLGMHFVMGM